MRRSVGVGHVLHVAVPVDRHGCLVVVGGERERRPEGVGPEDLLPVGADRPEEGFVGGRDGVEPLVDEERPDLEGGEEVRPEGEPTARSGRPADRRASPTTGGGKATPRPDGP